MSNFAPFREESKKSRADNIYLQDDTLPRKIRLVLFPNDANETRSHCAMSGYLLIDDVCQTRVYLNAKESREGKKYFQGDQEHVKWVEHRRG